MSARPWLVALSLSLLLGGCRPVQLWLGGRLDAGLDDGPTDASAIDDAAFAMDAAARPDVGTMDSGAGTGGSAGMDSGAGTGGVQATDDAGQEPDSATPDSGTTCSDNMQKDDETDVDCGGSCPPCALDQMCLGDVDCSPSAPGCDGAHGGCTCNAVTQRCVASHCLDQRTDADETDVDCGGTCKGCGPSKDCLIDDDCSDTASGCDPGSGCFCDALTSSCVYSHCFDHKISMGESDLDCGSSDCAKCVLGQACYLNFGCQSNACDGISAVCVQNQCADHHKDGSETDSDCGGGYCPPCSTGRKCLSNFDCETGFCSGAPKTCQ